MPFFFLFFLSRVSSNRTIKNLAELLVGSWNLDKEVGKLYFVILFYVVICDI